MDDFEKSIEQLTACMVAEWGLRKWAAPIRTRWAGRKDRPADRFQWLAQALTEVDERYTPIPGVDALAAWAEHTPERSAAALAVAAERTIDAPGRACLQKALAWSSALDA